MGAILNGLSHSKVRPFGSGFLIFSDYMKPAIRLSALMELPVIYVFTHDSIGVGEDGLGLPQSGPLLFHDGALDGVVNERDDLPGSDRIARADADRQQPADYLGRDVHALFGANHPGGFHGGDEVPRRDGLRLDPDPGIGRLHAQQDHREHGGRESEGDQNLLQGIRFRRR